MKAEVRKLAALSAIVHQDLNAMARLHTELSGLRSALAYLLHNLYCALENCFEQISRTFENHVTEPAQWHKELLGKMFLTIPTVRPAVLPPDLRPFLNNLRGFRHLFRHSCDFEIDPVRLTGLVQDWMQAQPRLVAALTRFRNLLLQQVRQAETDADLDGA